MNPGSIRLRLLMAAAIAVIVALAIAGTGLIFLFERHVERRVARELTGYLNQLIVATSVASDGTLSVSGGPYDPRFSTPLSGLYWQVDAPGDATSVRSRSLWESALDLGALPADGRLHTTEVAGPEKRRLFVVDRVIHDASGKTFRVAVAEDHRSVAIATSEFAAELVPSLAILAAVLILAMWLQVTVGLRPLERLRLAVSKVVTGDSARLEATVPTEVQPLADEINHLLDAQAKALARARSGATDLAHGLKTPLQVLSGDIRKLREKGETRIADEIDTVAQSIRRHVDRELARVRVAPAAAVKAARSDVAGVASRVISVVKRTPQGEQLTFAVDAPPGIAAAIDEADLAEILGNLIENAARYAKAGVRVSAEDCDSATRITVADDGPGIPDQAHAAALARGVRLDTSGGTGLGLAIVSDVVEAYGGALDIANAAPGLSVTVTLPHRHGGYGPSAPTVS